MSINVSKDKYIRVNWENLISAGWNNIKNWTQTRGHWLIDGKEIKKLNKINPAENINKNTQNFLGMSLMQKQAPPSYKLQNYDLSNVSFQVKDR